MTVDEMRAIQLERKLQTSRRLTWLSIDGSRDGSRAASRFHARSLEHPSRPESFQLL
jgi:hypothetical protein